MLNKQNIKLPVGLSKDWNDEQIASMSEIAYKLSHMWKHAFGEDWQKKISVDTLKELYKRM
jgi:3-deoxy-alpha-D-manno-octulosonate 8-oxidase